VYFVCGVDVCIVCESGVIACVRVWLRVCVRVCGMCGVCGIGCVFVCCASVRFCVVYMRVLCVCLMCGVCVRVRFLCV